MSRLMLTLVLFALPSNLFASDATKAAWAWAKSSPEACPKCKAALAWASIKPEAEPAKIPDKPKPRVPKSNIQGWHYADPGELSAPGNHWHVCTTCGRVCQHGDESFGNRSAHTCVCGTVNYDKTPGVAVRNCPNGNCPLR